VRVLRDAREVGRGYLELTGVLAAACAFEHLHLLDVTTRAPIALTTVQTSVCVAISRGPLISMPK